MKKEKNGSDCIAILSTPPEQWRIRPPSCLWQANETSSSPVPCHMCEFCLSMPRLGECRKCWFWKSNNVPHLVWSRRMLTECISDEDQGNIIGSVLSADVFVRVPIPRSQRILSDRLGSLLQSTRIPDTLCVRLGGFGFYCVSDPMLILAGRVRHSYRYPITNQGPKKME